jgi:hypothetical protein
MAKAIKKYQNGLSIRFLVKDKKYYITYGVMHIMINGEYSDGFKTFEEAEKVLLSLKDRNSTLHWGF